MTREELEKRLESAEKQMIGLQDEIQNLKMKLAEAQDEPEIPDKPFFEMDEKFYYLDSMTDGVEDSCIDDEIDAIDFNMFHTERYADEFAKKCKLIAMMLHCKWYLDRDYVPNWNDRKEIKWSILFDGDANGLNCASWIYPQPFLVYFSSSVVAKKCAEWLNEHWRDGNAD